MENTIEEIPIFWLLGMRFVTGALVLAALCLRRFKKLSRKIVWQGCVLGALLFSGYVAQTFGIADPGTTPGKNAFLTAVYCVIVPFLYWITSKKRPGAQNVLAAFIGLAGIGLVSINAGLHIYPGDLLTLLCGLFYAAHIVAVTEFSKASDVFLLTFVQFACAGVLSVAFGGCLERFPASISTGSVWSLIYLCFLATAAALLMQNIGQKYTPPATAALILSLEAVFGVLFSILFAEEELTVRVGFGFGLIFLAIVISEVGFGFLRRLTGGARGG